MQWQPIETAPKDGTHILAYGESRYSIVEAETQAIIFWWEKPCDLGHWTTLYGLEGMVFRPTHWMPLPPNPAMEAFEESLEEYGEVYQRLADG